MRQQLAASNFNDAYAFLGTALAAFRAAHALEAPAQAEEEQGGCASEIRVVGDPPPPWGATCQGAPGFPVEDALHGDAGMGQDRDEDERIDDLRDSVEMEDWGREGGHRGDGAVEKTRAGPGVDAR